MRIIKLLSTEHQHHPIAVSHAPEEPPVVQARMDGLPVVFLPEGVGEVTLDCVLCGCRLMEREDYLLEDLEPWQELETVE